MPGHNYVHVVTWTQVLLQFEVAHQTSYHGCRIFVLLEGAHACGRLSVSNLYVMGRSVS